MSESEAAERTEGAARVIVYTTDFCGYCERAKMLLSMRGVPFEELKIRRGAEGRAQLARLGGGAWTFPQIVLDGRPIGGFRELVKLDRAGDLAGLVR